MSWRFGVVNTTEVLAKIAELHALASAETSEFDRDKDPLGFTPFEEPYLDVLEEIGSGLETVLGWCNAHPPALRPPRLDGRPHASPPVASGFSDKIACMLLDHAAATRLRNRIKRTFTNGVTARLAATELATDADRLARRIEQAIGDLIMFEIERRAEDTSGDE